MAMTYLGHPYEVRFPTESGPQEWVTARAISRHRTLDGAHAGLVKQNRIMRKIQAPTRARIYQWNGTAWILLGGTEGHPND